MTKEETSLLLYLETRVVDDGGAVDVRRMNEEDFEIATRWNTEGFIQFGKINPPFKHPGTTHWVKLSDEAWVAAHIERLARAERTFAKYFEPMGVENEA